MTVLKSRNYKMKFKDYRYWFNREIMRLIFWWIISSRKREMRMLQVLEF